MTSQTFRTIHMWVSDDVSLSSAQPTTEPGAGLSLAEGKPPEAVYRVDIIDALRSILEANSRLLDADDFDAGVMEWIKTITLTFGAHAGISALLEAAGDEFVPVDYPYLWVTPEHPAPAAFTMSVPRTRQFSDWDRRLADGETICANIRDLEEDESRAFWERTACRSNIIVPVNIDNGRRSFFGLDFAEEQLFDEEVVEAVRSAAYGLAGALRRHALNRELIETERQRAFEAKQSLAERERRNELLRAVVAMSEVLVAARALEDAAPTVLKRLGEALALDHSFIGVLDPKENATPGRSSPLRTLSSWTCPNFEMRPDRRVAEIDRFFPAFDRLRLGDFVVGAPPATDTFERSTGAQYLCPIMIDQELWGVLVGTDSRDGRLIDDPEIAAIRLVASAIGNVIKREHLTASQRDAERELTLEKARMAREIHDTLAQGFTGVIMQLHATEDALEAGDDVDAARHVSRAVDRARFGLAEARRSVHALRPPLLDDGDLVRAIEKLGQRLYEGVAISFGVEVSGDVRRFTEPANIELFRIVQEAIGNALRHSRGRGVVVSLDYRDPDVFSLSVVDDGCGFVTDAADGTGYGLVSMRERAERLNAGFDLSAVPGEGTTLRISMPVTDFLQSQRSARTDLDGGTR